MSKRILSLLLAALLLFCCAAGASAIGEDPTAGTERTAHEQTSSETEEPPGGDRFSYTNFTMTGLNINAGGTATCVADFGGYAGITTKVDISMTLQKRVLLLFWTDEATWSQSFKGHTGTLSKTKTVTSGTYRVQATYIAYSDTKSETITSTSPSMTY